MQSSKPRGLTPTTELLGQSQLLIDHVKGTIQKTSAKKQPGHVEFANGATCHILGKITKNRRSTAYVQLKSSFRVHGVTSFIKNERYIPMW